MRGYEVNIAADRLVAHRGYPRHYPENTLSGIDAAIQAGAKYIEVDVQLSADGVAMLFHDRDLQRLCHQPGALYRYGLRELKMFRSGGSKIPELKALTVLLESHPSVTAFIELKRISIAHFGEEQIVTTVLNILQPVLNQCVMISYSLSALEKVRELSSQPIAVVADNWLELKQIPVQALQPEYLFCDIQSLPEQDDVHIPGAVLAVYECIDAGLAREVLNRGVDLVETFAIGEMIVSLQKGKDL
ncbi:Glycerophosphoryl diester phosphodiesterase [hydrothermal vent metagenome]|uniref:Glycerophosphoryl diester phosphodiesterase n=1 Tax=hydrothermal vent metagenome TaxID=652676 RepID=A0A3B1BF20_9ZZZZ